MPDDIWGLIALIVISLFLIFPTKASIPQEINLDRLVLVQGNSVKAMSVPRYPKVYTLGSLIDRIIHCESGGDPKVCNQEFGCYAGMGLFQLIPSTVKYCEEKLGREIDPFDIDDNIACAMWLLENEGVKHWEQSKACWSL